jgi:hypothetical protein
MAIIVVAVIVAQRQKIIGNQALARVLCHLRDGLTRR